MERDSSAGDAAAEDDRWECALLFEWVSGDRQTACWCRGDRMLWGGDFNMPLWIFAAASSSQRSSGQTKRNIAAKVARTARIGMNFSFMVYCNCPKTNVTSQNNQRNKIFPSCGR